MNRRTKWIAGGALAFATIAAGATIAAASGGEGPDQPITGDALAKASAAALANTEGGTVTETEVGDEDSYYEVEVTRPDGTKVDVQLDANFTVVSSAADNEGPNDPNDSRE